ncbi:histone-lysine N-methyltransferase SETD1A-like [Stegodyphus dumicola]|uniref:histone-lysine N-methyltransferase SETD1A-like n=1 Tax=Stegodyphus dumicola TaxID=202533 RepID=UPI0015B0F32C|nr:histone-lysine N-methyltransferase SETD1A-like [Stegodyphus dumicola]
MMRDEEATDAFRLQQMALPSPVISSNDAGEAHTSSASPGRVPQSSVGCRGVVNGGYCGDAEEYNTRFVDNRVAVAVSAEERTGSHDQSTADSFGQSLLYCVPSTTTSSSTSCEDSNFSRGDAFRIPRRYPRINRIYRSRLWFEGRHWGTPLPRDANRGPNSSDVPSSNIQFPDRPEVGQDTSRLSSGGRTKTSSKESSASATAVQVAAKEVYNIGIFYSDTDLCKKSPTLSDSPHHHKLDHVCESGVSSDKQIGDVNLSSSMTSLGGGLGDGISVPHEHARRSSNSCRSTRRLTTHTQLTPDTFAPPPPLDTPSSDTNINNNNTLPDILNSHLPPPYSTLPPVTVERGGGSRRLPPPSHPPPPPPPTTAPACPHLTANPRRTSRGGGGRGGAFRGFHPRERSGGRRGGPSFAGAPAASESDEPKHCCGVMVTQTVSIRWFIVMIAFVGLCCAIVGTVLGALKATGREHLTVSLLMIGKYFSFSLIISH